MNFKTVSISWILGRQKAKLLLIYFYPLHTKCTQEEKKEKKTRQEQQYATTNGNGHVFSSTVTWNITLSCFLVSVIDCLQILEWQCHITLGSLMNYVIDCLFIIERQRHRRIAFEQSKLPYLHQQFRNLMSKILYFKASYERSWFYQ